MRIFFATNALKKDDGIPPGTVTPRPVRRLGVIGAGFMGAGIAGTAVSQASVEARLKDSDLPRVGKGLFAATEILRGQLTRLVGRRALINDRAHQRLAAPEPEQQTRTLRLQ